MPDRAAGTCGGGRRRLEEPPGASTRVRWSALVVAVLVAGCSGAPPTDTPNVPLTDGAALAAGNATAAAPAAPPAHGTLFLVGPTLLNATGLANRTVLASLGGALPQTMAWNTTLRGGGNSSFARLALWVDLQSSALQPGVGGDPGCTASLTVLVVRNGTAASQAGGCASAGTGTVPPGEHLLEFSTPLVAWPDGLRLSPGDGVAVQVAFGLSFPQGGGYVLGGGDRPSAFWLDGLAEPAA